MMAVSRGLRVNIGWWRRFDRLRGPVSDYHRLSIMVRPP